MLDPAAKKWQSFEFARENLKATHEALLKSEELLSAKVKRDEEAKRRFDEMQLELAKLTNEDMSMVCLPSLPSDQEL